MDLFISRQFGLLFVGTTAICQFVLMMQFLWRFVDEVIGKGLTIDVLAQFFFYMGLMLVPQALPLGILLSSLITFGNLGESSELTAIKASGISLMKTFRSLIFLSVMIACVSFYFQNHIGPQANMKLIQLLISMKQKSPELEIPEGIFYDGIPGTNIYVQKKDLKTGILYGVMIYKMTGSYEDQAIILADSGKIQSTAERKHLLLTLWDGEWFENMKSMEISGSASVPYRRETFTTKKILIDFDPEFNLSDGSLFSNDPKTKSLDKIMFAMDSLNHEFDSVAKAFYAETKYAFYNDGMMRAKDTIRIQRGLDKKKIDFDKVFTKLPPDKKRSVLEQARNQINGLISDLEFKRMVSGDGERLLRLHQMEAINKFSLALSCVIFFFIGAPLGSIIRKGGLGIPVIVSVLIFIVYYILENSGYRMARSGIWAVWFGKSLAPGVLIPLAVFTTYKANSESVIFNFDSYKTTLQKILGVRIKRHIHRKEVIIDEPDYASDTEKLSEIKQEILHYEQSRKLKKAPSYLKIFFKYHPDNHIMCISEKLEQVIENLSNATDHKMINKLNQFPVISEKAHTRPFDRQSLNAVLGVILPLGVFFYLRMWFFRLRLYRDLQTIKNTADETISLIKGDQMPEMTRKEN